MKKNIALSVAVVATFLVLAACSSIDKKAPLVPKDAGVVFHINTNSLSKKLSWEEIKQSSWFVELTSKHNDSFAKKILEDPGASGIETNEGLYIFTRKDADGAGYAGFTGYLKDPAAFEVFNKKLLESGEVKANNDLKSIAFRDRGLVSWNEGKFLYLLATPSAGIRFSDSMPKFTDPVVADLPSVANRIFHYKNDSLLVDDDRFASLLKDEGDAHLWSNAETLTADNFNMGFMSLIKTEVYFRETVTTSTLSFDKGKVVGHVKTYSNKQMSDLMRKYSGDNINTDYIKRIPSDNVIGVFAANIKPEGIKQFLKLGGLDGLANSALGKHNLTLDQVTAAAKGDIMIAVTDFIARKKMISLGKGMDSLPITSRGPEVLLCMTINDKALFQRFADAIQSEAENSKFPLGLTLKIENDLFVAGTSASIVDQYLKGGKKDFPFVSRMSGHPVAMYGSLDLLLSSFRSAGDTSATAFGSKSMMWKDVLMTGGEFKDDAIVQKVEFTMVDPNTNSLQQLNAYFNTLAEKRKSY